MQATEKKKQEYQRRKQNIHKNRLSMPNQKCDVNKKKTRAHLILCKQARLRKS